ncbi:TPA: hypothetical protein JLL89_004630 [Escherichia coli]|uniref:hypothetical protein n=1 Tax=Escherichia coli TaxID=562 RepID=UPI000DD4D8E9|nr:hypothetical protein [Escherichia coli]EFE7736961.1 hypothetical protein [Escherichia coli]HAV8369916.1 hypothetical protein [Escherichia coli]HAW2397081.1 hypothetical protein [Escherichia coli]HAW4010467.1 hypothetical protein [Escherichia coli]HAW7847846.1 hypothetical protein [Escherichia coli]
MACKSGPFSSPADEDRASPGLLYGMTLSGTACALRDFAHAQNHPSDGRPHANGNTPRRLPAATAVCSSGQSCCRFAFMVAGRLFIILVIVMRIFLLLLFIFFIATRNGI